MDQKTYLTGHDDPEADMVMECKDGVRLRVHSYILQAHSLYSRDMPAHSKEVSGDSEKVVAVDASSDDFSLLLSIINIETTAKYAKWSQLENVIELGSRYKFLRLPELIRYHVRQNITGGCAWEIFVFASNNDFADLAKLAITNLANSNFFRGKQAKDIKAATFRGVPGAYASAFVNALNDNPCQKGWNHDNRWACIAKDFDP